MPRPPSEQQDRSPGVRSLRAEIHARLGDFTTSEQRVANALLSRYPVAGLERVTSFARRAHVSTATVLRFVNKLGFPLYSDFQAALLTQLEDTLQSPLTRLTHTEAGHRDRSNPLRRYAEVARENIGRTIEMVPPAVFKAVVALLADERRPLLLIGGRYTSTIARHMALLLQPVRPNVQYLSGEAHRWATLLLDVRRSAVMVVFDTRRYQHDLIEFASMAAQKGVTVVLFTDPWHSDLARVARHVVSAPVAAPSIFDSFVAHLVIAEAMVAAATEQIGKHVKPRLQRLEQLYGAINGGPSARFSVATESHQDGS